MATAQLSKAERKQQRALAQARRDELVSHYLGSVKTKKSYLLYSGSVILGDELVIIGKPRADHFFAVEGDPEIYGVEYGPLNVDVRLDGIEQKVRFDSIVRYHDNRREFRSVKMRPSQSFELQARAAVELGGSFVIIDKAWLKAHGMRIHNWRRALTSHRICSRVNYSSTKGFIMQYVKAHQHATFGELLALYDKVHRPHVVAALVELVGKRALRSDLDVRPWSRHSTVWMGRDDT